MVGLAACAPSGGLAVDELEKELMALTLSDHPGLVTAVNCPKPLSPDSGDVVVCEVIIGSQSAPLQVTFGSNRGDVMDAEVTARLVSMEDIERAVELELTADLDQVTSLRCPQSVMVVTEGASVPCVVTDAAGVERDLFVTPGNDGSVGLTLTP